MTLTSTFRLLALSSVIGLSACGTVPGLSDLGAYKTGTQISDTQMATATDNKSASGDIVALVGQPSRKAQVGAKEIWYYDFTQIGQALIGKNISETTAFEFNNKGILLAHYKTAGQGGSSSNALLKAAGK